MKNNDHGKDGKELNGLSQLYQPKGLHKYSY
jgi:hypothetical protein